jgi:outer membrane protein assembly factor BamB
MLYVKYFKRRELKKERKKMINSAKFSRNKISATVIAIFLMLSMTTSLVLLPTTNAHTPPYAYTTFCYVAPTPPTIGVGQQMLIVWWLNAIPPTAAGATGDRWHVSMNVIKPDGTNETLGPETSDPVGGGYFTYTPTETGTYTIQGFFPGQTITGIPDQTQNVAVNDTYSASMSVPEYFTVQQEPIPSYVETPLPTDYWTRPIYDNNRGWGDAVMGQWLGQPWDNTLRTLGVQNQEALLSPHILWTHPDWSGGIMGSYVDTSFYNGIAYEGFSSPLICLDGMGYYAQDNSPIQGWYCINLYNGQTEYFQNNTDGTHPIPAMGQLLNYESPNQDGGFSYLWQTSGLSLGTGNGTVWGMMDASTNNANGNIANSGVGTIICKIANVSTTGTEFRDSIGSICYLNFANLGTATAPNYYMQIWNSTQAIWWHPSYGIAPPATLYNGTTNLPLTDTSNDYWMWRPGAGASPGQSTTGYGAIYDGHNGYSMNVSVASIFGPRNSIVNQTGTIQQIVPDQMVIVGAAGQNDARGDVQGFLTAYSLAAPTWGQTLWTTTFNPPAATAADSYPNATYGGGVFMGSLDWNSGTFAFMEGLTGQIYVYNITTGQQLWHKSFTEPWYYYDYRISGAGTLSTSLFFHNGKAYTIGISGVVNCFDATTGDFLWNWTAPNIGYLEVQGTTYTPLSLQFFIDDPVTGHTYVYLDGSVGWAGQTVPIRRDSALYCVDCNTGQMAWRLEAYPSTANNAASKVVISDGHIIYLDNHDNNIYCLGKGPSATTVSAPQNNPQLGSSVTITGTVTDQTNSGRINSAGSVDFLLKGTPAISDASMEAWMEHVFQQRPLPTNATGVPVVLTAIDPNGNYINIGNVTSDLTGAYGCNWKPQVSGTYQIIATFQGSNSYGSSFAQTYMSVSEASPTASPYPVTNLPPTETYITLSTIAIIIAIAVIGALILLSLRKRP